MNLFELCTILSVLMMLSIVDEGASESGKITIHYIGKVAKILRSDISVMIAILVTHDMC